MFSAFLVLREGNRGHLRMREEAQARLRNRTEPGSEDAGPAPVTNLRIDKWLQNGDAHQDAGGHMGAHVADQHEGSVGKLARWQRCRGWRVAGPSTILVGLSLRVVAGIVGVAGSARSSSGGNGSPSSSGCNILCADHLSHSRSGDPCHVHGPAPERGSARQVWKFSALGWCSCFNQSWCCTTQLKHAQNMVGFMFDCRVGHRSPSHS